MSIENFQWYNPVHLIVKKDGSPEIAEYMSRDGIKSALMVYGKASIKKNGLYDKIVAALKKHGIQIYELPGIRANPEINDVIKGVDLCRQHKIQAVLPVGGGSCYDSAKAIAVGAKLPMDTPSSAVWEYYEGKRKATEAIPIYGVLTISATGSEMNDGGVCQNDAEKKKWSFAAKCCFPRVSIVDPAIQAGLPWY